MLRLNLLKESDLEEIGVKKGHRKEIFKHQESPQPRAQSLVNLEYNLFLSILRISKCKNALVENV